MQIQPKATLRLSSHSRRARQAALLSEDAFKGGTRGLSHGGPGLRSPWLAGPGHLWEAVRRRDGQTAPE